MSLPRPRFTCTPCRAPYARHPDADRSRACIRRGGRRRACVCPLQFSPFGTPFPGYAAPRGRGMIPLSSRNPPKGANRGGRQRGGRYGADGGMEPLHLHASDARSGLAVRAPPPYGLPPPLRRSVPFAPSAPRGGARWSGRHRLSPFRASTRCRPSVDGDHSERSLKTKPVPRVAGCHHEQGNPRVAP